MKELKNIVYQKKLDFYNNFEDIVELIKEVFELNPHSVHSLNKHKEGIYVVKLDNLDIVYIMNENKTECQIVKILVANQQPNINKEPSNQ